MALSVMSLELPSFFILFCQKQCILWSIFTSGSRMMYDFFHEMPLLSNRNANMDHSCEGRFIQWKQGAENTSPGIDYLNILYQILPIIPFNTISKEKELCH